jgi:hypothetical protein
MNPTYYDLMVASATRDLKERAMAAKVARSRAAQPRRKDNRKLAARGAR